MISPKVLFFDIDGTLWKREKGISDDTFFALQQARKNGHLIFINSGRSQAHIIDEKLLAVGWDGFVSGCGTYISIGDTVIRDNFIDTAELEKVITFARIHKVKIILEGRDHLYFDGEEFDGDPYGEILKRELHYGQWTIKDHWGQWQAAKFSVDLTDPELGARWVSEMEKNYHLIRHTNAVYEVIPYGYSKATGMKEVMDYLGLTMADSIAFGDGNNDAEMLAAAGTAVVIDNAPENILAMADLTTPGPLEGGIRKALEKLELI